MLLSHLITCSAVGALALAVLFAWAFVMTVGQILRPFGGGW
jgi:hypothetical protein